jgi:predicted RND superfamily exporter protein
MKGILRHPKLCIAFIAVLTLFFALQLPRAQLDNNNMRFLPEKNQARVISEYIDETFGGSMMILVGLERPYGTVFDPVFLERVKTFSLAVENVDLVKDVNSIMSTQYISADGDTIVVADLVGQDFTGSQEEIAELKRRIASWDLFQGSIISKDLRAAQIIITLDVTTEESTKPEATASLVKIRGMAREMFDGLAEVYVTGQTVINENINESIIQDVLLLIPLVVILVLGVLFFSFRRFSFVMLPLITVIVAVIWTVGAMVLIGMKLSILTTILPVILVAVGSAYGIHVVTHYMEDTGDRDLSVEEHQEFIFTLMGKLIKPVALAALTTFAGFVSFCFTSIVPIQEFGYGSSFGVIACFIIAVTLIPSLLLARGPGKAKQKAVSTDAPRTDKSGKVIGNFFLKITNRKKTVLFVTAAAVLLCLYGVSKLIVDNVVIEYFRNETDISRSDRFIREYFGGSKEVTLVVEADTTEDLLDPAVLSAVDNLSAYLSERVPAVGKVVGFTDIIKRINQVFNADEGPYGLRPTGLLSIEDDSKPLDDDFGFGFGFGFEDTGFDDFSDAPFAETVPTIAHSLDSYSAADLITLLDTAAGKSSSLNGSELIGELKRLINYDGFSYYEIPADPARYGKKSPDELQRLVSNYLVLLAGEDSGYSNDPLEPTALRTTIQLRTTGQKDTQAVIDDINTYIAANFPGNVRTLMGGGAVQELAITDLIVNAQIISVAVSVLMVFLIVALSNRSAAAGIIAAVPLAIAILSNFAVMGFLGIKLNIGTALIASLSVGIGIDYTIHFIDSFKREYQTGDADFLRRAFSSCGKAIVINAVSVGAGFSVLAFSLFRILADFGALIALSMIITAIISLTVIPVLLITVKPKFIYGGKK